MPKSSPSPALISLGDLYAAPVPVTCTLDTAKGSVEVVMQVQKDRLTVGLMQDLFKASESQEAEIEAMTSWISELVVSWNLAEPPTADTAKRLGIGVLAKVVQAIQKGIAGDSDDPEHPNE